MKIAVTTTGQSLESPVEARFGRAAGMLLVDPDTWQTKYLSNAEADTLSHGAGIAAAERVARAGATVLLTGQVGPKAFDALTAAGVVIGHSVADLTVREAVAAYQRGEVECASSPSNRGHRG